MDTPALPDAACPCARGVFFFQDIELIAWLGQDANLSDISLERCRLCGACWLTLQHEAEAFTASGVWYRVPLDEAEIAHVTAANARAHVEAAPWYWAGGSYFRGTFKSSGKLVGMGL